MPRILKLFCTILLVAAAFVNYQLWWVMVIENNLGGTSGLSAIFPIFVWPAGVAIFTFYALYAIWREL